MFQLLLLVAYFQSSADRDMEEADAWEAYLAAAIIKAQSQSDGLPGRPSYRH